MSFLRAHDGSFIVESRISVFAGHEFLDMTLDFSNFSWMRDNLIPCTISFPTVSGFDDLLFHDPNALFNSWSSSRPALAIGLAVKWRSFMAV